MTNLCNPGDVVVIDFPGVSGIKRRPAVVLSSAVYHALRPDIVVGLITSQRTNVGPTGYTLQDWAAVPVAIDALAVYVHKDNPIKGLTVPQLDAVFSATRKCGFGEDITHWGRLGLSDE